MPIRETWALRIFTLLAALLRAELVLTLRTADFIDNSYLIQPTLGQHPRHRLIDGRLSLTLTLTLTLPSVSQVVKGKDWFAVVRPGTQGQGIEVGTCRVHPNLHHSSLRQAT